MGWFTIILGDHLHSGLVNVIRIAIEPIDGRLIGRDGRFDVIDIRITDIIFVASDGRFVVDITGNIGVVIEIIGVGVDDIGIGVVKNIDVDYTGFAGVRFVIEAIGVVIEAIGFVIEAIVTEATGFAGVRFVIEAIGFVIEAIGVVIEFIHVVEGFAVAIDVIVTGNNGRLRNFGRGIEVAFIAVIFIFGIIVRIGTAISFCGILNLWNTVNGLIIAVIIIGGGGVTAGVIIIAEKVDAVNVIFEVVDIGRDSFAEHIG